MDHSERSGTSCSGKATYHTIGECERAMKALARRGAFGHAKSRNVHPYRCNTCQGWHHSSMTRAEYEERAHYRLVPV